MNINDNRTSDLSFRIAEVEKMDDKLLAFTLDELARTESETFRDMWMVPVAIVAARRLGA